MAYTPELSGRSSSMLRRIAWALGKPMTEAIEDVFEYIPNILDKKKVCAGCRDKSICQWCPFNKSNKMEVEKCNIWPHLER